ncbi:MAG: zinc/iron permease [Firmicutes bacterium]|nr:zinc/iron permease [Bacillota bacterium]
MEIVLISALAGLATGLGAVIIFIFGQPSKRLLSGMLGFAAGIMLAISAFDLLPEAVELGSVTGAVLGFLAGVALMMGLDLLVPHLHIGSGEQEGGDPEMVKVGYFIFLGIALHNLPEGLAIGAGYSADLRLGAAIALALALHNVPEGMATAMPLVAGGVGKWKVIGLTTLAGLMTPVGTLLGKVVFAAGSGLVAAALAFAAGAMVYIVSDELIPQSHRFHSHWANIGLVAGFVLGFVIA